MNKEEKEISQYLIKLFKETIPFAWDKIFMRQEIGFDDGYFSFQNEFFVKNKCTQKFEYSADLKSENSEYIKIVEQKRTPQEYMKQYCINLYKEEGRVFKVFLFEADNTENYEGKIHEKLELNEENSFDRFLLWKYNMIGFENLSLGFQGLIKENLPKLFEENNKVNESKENMGWDAISQCFDTLYPDQKDPKHYGTLIKWNLGGKDPLDGISIYDGGEYWHFVTYGMSELYEKESDNKEVSGYGMEFTLKLKKSNDQKDEEEIKGICGILQSIARITFTKGEIFKVNEYLYTGQKTGMDTKSKSDITGFITVPEPKIAKIDTANGTVEFVEFIGVTDAELQKILSKEITVQELYTKLGTDVTDYNRKSIF